MSFLKLSKRDWIFIGIFFFLIFVIYGQSLAGKFVFDDRNIVANEAMLSNLQSIGQTFMHPFWSTDAGLYRPTTLLSYTINYTFLGHGPFGFHLINLLLYFFTCSLIYLFIKRLFKKDYLAFFTTLLFLVLPIHTEVIANIAGRSEILALLFSILALLEFTSEKKINLWRTLLWVFLAIGAKETAIAIVPIILIALYIKEGKLNIEMIKKYFSSIFAVIIGALFYFFLRFFSLGPLHFLGVKTTLIENPLIFTDTWSRICTSFQIFWMYIEKTFWPTNLCSDYSYNQIPVTNNFFNFGTIMGFIIFIGAISLIFIYIKKRPIISLSASIFILSFIPVSNILFPIGTIAGERLMFFPSLGISLGIIYIIYELYLKLKNKNAKIIFLSIFILIISIYGITSLIRQRVWTNEEKLFLSAEKCAPNSVLSRSNAGAMYLLRGNLEKAQEELEFAKSIKPIYSKGLNNLGLVYFKKGEYQKAEELYVEALRQEFPYDGAYENLIMLYLDQGQIQKAKHWMMYLYPNDEIMIDLSIKKYLEENKK
jgi:tetratricopeptide (TPR) repeat protein